MNANEFLSKQHREVEKLYKEFQTATGDRKNDCGKEIVLNLTVHAEIEEELYYPEIEKAGDKKLVDEYKAEHQGIKLQVAKLAMMTTDNDKYEPTMTALMEAVAHHVEEEEEEGMPEAEKLVGTATLDVLGAKLEKRAEELKQSTIKRLWAAI